MTKAYHTGPGTAVEEAITMGHVLPAAMRLDHSIWMWDRQNGINDILKRFGDRTPDERALDAVADLVDEQASKLIRQQERHSIHPTQRNTQFQFLDLLAGDLDYVFLSLGDWVYWGRSEPSGFVFDAESLVHDGALVRIRDLGPLYSAALNEFVFRKHKSVIQAKRELRETFQSIAHENTEAGNLNLRRVIRSRGAGNAELLWPGALDVARATEIWADGQRIDQSSPSLGRSIPSRDPKRLFFFWDLDKDIREPGALVAVSPAEWHNHRRGAVEGWRGPELESEDFGTMSLQSFSCLKDIAVDENGYWTCLALHRESKGMP